MSRDSTFTALPTTEWSSSNRTATAVGGNTIFANYIGTDPSGILDEPNNEGIHLIHSPKDLIEDNLISGNSQSGIFVADQFCEGTQIESNLIGVDVSGQFALGNKVNGVALGAPPNPIAGDGFASGVTVGGISLADRNIISGNGQAGIWIKGGTANDVLANYIGVAKDGVTPIPNGQISSTANVAFGTSGVLIDGGSGNEIGGEFVEQRNVISGNTTDGIDILNGSTGNVVEGNFIGINALSTAAVANGDDGIYI